MPTKTQSNATGAKSSQTTNRQPEKQAQKPPFIRAGINWLNPKDDDNIRATASLTIGGAFAVHGVKVIRSKDKGDFVSMPSYKKGEEYKDIFHAVTKEAREQINAVVMKAYEQKLAEQNQDNELAEDEGQDTPADEPSTEKGQSMT